MSVVSSSADGKEASAAVAVALALDLCLVQTWGGSREIRYCLLGSPNPIFTAPDDAGDGGFWGACVQVKRDLVCLSIGTL